MLHKKEYRKLTKYSKAAGGALGEQVNNILINLLKKAYVPPKPYVDPFPNSMWKD